MNRLAVGMYLAVLLSCSKGSGDKSGALSLVSDEERQHMDRVTLAAARANQTRRCERPVLAGEPRPGSADTDMLVLLDPGGPLADCYQRVKAATGDDEDRDSLLDRLRDQTGAARPLDDPDSTAGPVDAIDSSCQRAGELLAAAVGHGDACSPFLPGRRGSGQLMPVIWLSKAVLVRARALARTGDRFGAAELILHALRFQQDLSRGGTSLLEPMIGVAAAKIVLPELHRVLAELATDELGDVAEMIDRLVASRVHPSSYIEALALDFALYEALPQLHGPGWEPPGGYRADQPPPVVATDPMTRDGLVLAWRGLTEAVPRLRAACPPAAPTRTCLLEAARVSKQIAAEPVPTSMEAFVAEIEAAAPDGADVRQLVRERVVSVLKSIAVPAYDRYLWRLAWLDAALVAVQVHAHSRLSRARGGPCPLNPGSAALGSALVVEAAPVGYALEAPEWLYQTDWTGDEPRQLAAIACGK